MKLRAITPINYSHKIIEPGKTFECDEADAPALIDVGAAEVVTTRKEEASK